MVVVVVMVGGCGGGRDCTYDGSSCTLDGVSCMW